MIAPLKNTNSHKITSFYELIWYWFAYDILSKRRPVKISLSHVHLEVIDVLFDTMKATKQKKKKELHDEDNNKVSSDKKYI